jgi:penicillin-binding protein 2
MGKNKSLGETPDFASSGRRTILLVLLGLVTALYLGRLAQIQLIQGSEFKTRSESQAIKQIRIEPFRGNLFDRNGRLIVHNEPSFSITLTPKDFKKETMPLLASVLGLDTNEINSLLKKYRTYPKYIPIKIKRDLDFNTISLVEEFNDHLPGIGINVESKRLYEFDGNMAHLLGYTREISARQLERMKYYNPGDVIGQDGIEKEYEPELKGREGVKFVTVNKFGQQVESYEGGEIDKSAINGFDLYLGIDIRVQQLAEDLLEGQRGCVVAIDPQDGSVIALASKPDFDPRDFSGKVPASIYSQLRDDPASPLMHRSIMAQYPPGSTWKMFIALAALQEGLITDKTVVHCPGGYQFGNRFWKCNGTHGSMNVRNAIKYSCNTFFYKTGVELGYENFEKYGQLFGFGQKTGIDLPHEKSGRLPTREWLTDRLGKNGAVQGKLVNYGIGQGEILTTPLQMAVYTAAIANGGKLFRPHVVNKMKNNFNGKIEEINIDYYNLPIDKKHFEIVKKGMNAVVNEAGGTAWRARVDSLHVCGKTGSAQNPHGDSHAWFVSFAPMENPRIAICVFVENSGSGGVVAAPIAQKIIDSYLNGFEKKQAPGESPADTTSREAEIMTVNQQESQ